MTDEQHVQQLVSIVEDLGLSDADVQRLALVIVSLLKQSWEEGWAWGWYAGGDDVLFRASKQSASIISH